MLPQGRFAAANNRRTMADRALRIVRGACHCGNVEGELRWPAKSTVITARHCGCSFCRKHGAAWTSNPDAELYLTVHDAGSVSVYRFGTSTADFLICSECGVPTVVVGGNPENYHAVVNVNTLDTTGFTLEDATTDFAGEEVEDRLARRRKNWIPSVTIRGLSLDERSR